MGHSLGAGVCLLAASLVPEVTCCISSAPSFSWFEKRVADRSGMASAYSGYLKVHPEKEKALLESLSYFDNINHVGNIKCPVLIGAGRLDEITPPENVYASYNKIKSPKSIYMYPFEDHAAGQQLFVPKAMAFVKKLWF